MKDQDQGKGEGEGEVLVSIRVRVKVGVMLKVRVKGSQSWSGRVQSQGKSNSPHICRVRVRSLRGKGMNKKFRTCTRIGYFDRDRDSAEVWRRSRVRLPVIGEVQVGTNQAVACNSAYVFDITTLPLSLPTFFLNRILSWSELSITASFSFRPV